MKIEDVGLDRDRCCASIGKMISERTYGVLAEGACVRKAEEVGEMMEWDHTPILPVGYCDHAPITAGARCWQMTIVYCTNEPEMRRRRAAEAQRVEQQRLAAQQAAEEERARKAEEARQKAEARAREEAAERERQQQLHQDEQRRRDDQQARVDKAQQRDEERRQREQSQRQAAVARSQQEYLAADQRRQQANQAMLNAINEQTVGGGANVSFGRGPLNGQVQLGTQVGGLGTWGGKDSVGYTIGVLATAQQFLRAGPVALELRVDGNFTYVTGSYSHLAFGPVGRGTLWLGRLGGFAGMGHTWLRVTGHPVTPQGIPIDVPDPVDFRNQQVGGCIGGHSKNAPMQACGGVVFADESGDKGWMAEGRIGIGLWATMIDLHLNPASDDGSRPSELLLLFAVGMRGAW
jgi:hypothetical protein